MFQIEGVVFIRQNSSDSRLSSLYLLTLQWIAKIIRQNSSSLPKGTNQVVFQRRGIFLAIEFFIGT